MPPVDTAPASVNRYLTRLLAAMCLQAGGELRIPLKAIRAVAEEDARQALLEDTDTKKDELVLRFGSKHSAVYPVEADNVCPASPKAPSSIPPSSPTPSGRPEPSPVSRPPLSLEELGRLERVIKAKRARASLQREQQQQDLLSQLEQNSPG